MPRAFRAQERERQDAHRREIPVLREPMMIVMLMMNYDDDQSTLMILTVARSRAKIRNYVCLQVSFDERRCGRKRFRCSRSTSCTLLRTPSLRGTFDGPCRRNFSPSSALLIRSKQQGRAGGGGGHLGTLAAPPSTTTTRRGMAKQARPAAHGEPLHACRLRCCAHSTEPR